MALLPSSGETTCAPRRPARPRNRGNVSGGRVLVWLLVLSHVFAFQTACTEGDDESDSSSDGGGGCNSGDDTGAGGDDNGGGGCNVQTDVAYTNPPGSDPSADSCVNGNAGDCSSDQLAVFCAGAPDSWPGVVSGSCRPASAGGAGEYCCTSTWAALPGYSAPLGPPTGAAPSPGFNPYVSTRSGGEDGGHADNGDADGQDASGESTSMTQVVATCDAGLEAEPAIEVDASDAGPLSNEIHVGDFEAGD
jgi:hypothetical protein